MQSVFSQTFCFRNCFIFYNVWNNVFTITIYYYLLFIKEKDGINDII